MQYTLYHRGTGEIVSLVDVPPEALHLQMRGRRQRVLAAIEGHYDAQTTRIVGGVPVPHQAAPVIAPWAVNAEAQRRIESRYPIWRQMNILRSGDAVGIEAMGRFIDAIRAASDVLDAMETVPADYVDDKYWPI